MNQCYYTTLGAISLYNYGIMVCQFVITTLHYIFDCINIKLEIYFHILIQINYFKKFCFNHVSVQSNYDSNTMNNQMNKILFI